MLFEELKNIRLKLIFLVWHTKVFFKTNFLKKFIIISLEVSANLLYYDLRDHYLLSVI